MKKSEFITKLNSQLKNLTQKDVEKIVNIFFEKISKSLIENKRIEIRGFGSFRLKKSNARKARNPKTGESIYVNEKKGIHFKMGKTLTKIINNKNE
tara:strand:+ start:4341 stop:4628 length:288 start_codon:yes stop_codon:yes gene_type:complete